MRTIKPIDMETLIYKYGFDYSVDPAPGYGAVATLGLNCMGANDADLEFREGHAVLEVLVDSDVMYVPQCLQTGYTLKIKMPIWLADHIAYVANKQQKEES